MKNSLKNEIIRFLYLICCLYTSYKTTSIEIFGLCVLFVLCGQLPFFLFYFYKEPKNSQKCVFVINIGILIMSVTILLNALEIINYEVFWVILFIELFLFSLSPLFLHKVQ